jgi:hypothetical protein
MKIGSREADEAYDRWHDKMADEWFGANDKTCPICNSDECFEQDTRNDEREMVALFIEEQGFPRLADMIRGLK